MPSEPTVDEVRELLEDATKYGSSMMDDEVIIKLCRHFLASPMTAGEFAGLVVQQIRGVGSERMKWFPEPPSGEWQEAADLVESIAREHNITIVEPTK